MSGETENQVSGWTTDTLREHLQRQVDALAAEFERLVAALDSRLQERYDTQTKANDVAFNAQQTAMQTALSSAERLVEQARAATEKAIDKAEQAAEKRFEAVNEFRGQLADQAATLLPRSEADVRFAALEEKVAKNDRALERLTGHDAGSDEARTTQRLDTGQLVAVILAILALATLAVGIVAVLTR